MLGFENVSQKPPTREEARKIVLEQTGDYFRTVSYGKETLSGNVFPRARRGGPGRFVGGAIGDIFGAADDDADAPPKEFYTIDAGVDERCAKFNERLSPILEAAVRAADPEVNFNRYGRLALVFPRCGTGWGTTWEQKIRTDEGELEFTISWIRELSMRVVPHELGHNMFLQHASSYYCKGGILTADCVDDEYGDDADAMGRIGPRHFNVYEKHQAGWIDDEQLQRVPNLTGIYRYELEPLEADGGLKGLRIPLSRAELETDAPASEFILEYRISIPGDYDATLPKRFLDGALVHIPMKTSHYDEQQPFLHTHLIDMDPGGEGDVLRSGKVWSAPNKHVKIKVGKTKNGRLPVEVVIGKPSLWDFLRKAVEVVIDKPSSRNFLRKTVDGAWGWLTGRRAAEKQPSGQPAAPGLRAAGLPRSVHRNAKEREPDTTRMAGLEEAYALGLAPIPEAGSASPDLCARAGQFRRLPSPLKERFNDEAAARGLAPSGLPCLSSGEILAHSLAFDRLRGGDAEGAREAFTWEGLAALKAERAAMEPERY